MCSGGRGVGEAGTGGFPPAAPPDPWVWKLELWEDSWMDGLEADGVGVQGVLAVAILRSLMLVRRAGEVPVNCETYFFKTESVWRIFHGYFFLSRFEKRKNLKDKKIKSVLRIFFSQMYLRELKSEIFMFKIESET